MPENIHQWTFIYEETKFKNSHYEYVFKIEWCPRCGTVKTGPHSEPGAYNYSQYFGVGPEGKYSGPPYKPEGFGYPSNDSKMDPPCGRWMVDEKNKVVPQK